MPLVQHSTPLSIQAELKAQHDDIRHLLAVAACHAAAYLTGRGPAQDLADAIDEARESLSMHNEREEILLAPLLAGRDAWSPARLARMFEEHRAEHTALERAFVGTPAEMAERLPALLEELDAHMAAEERTVLAPAVLR